MVADNGIYGFSWNDLVWSRFFPFYFQIKAINNGPFFLSSAQEESNPKSHRFPNKVFQVQFLIEVFLLLFD